MDNSQKEKNGGTSNVFVNTTFLAFNALVGSPGRHGVHIFGLSREQLIMATVAALILGIPLAIIVAMAPFWDRVGDVWLLKQLNSYVAPAIDDLTYQYRSEALPRFPLKRFLVASISMIELIVLSNFVALFARGVRRHALLVWTCYDRRKIFQYFGISCLIFCGLWYVLFFDWKVLAFLQSTGRRSVGLILYFVMSMPVVALVFGHLAAIVGLGGWRTASRKLRRLRAAFISIA
jgi:hypothetical protein